jgi:hypothetical protein
MGGLPPTCSVATLGTLAKAHARLRGQDSAHTEDAVVAAWVLEETLASVRLVFLGLLSFLPCCHSKSLILGSTALRQLCKTGVSTLGLNTTPTLAHCGLHALSSISIEEQLRTFGHRLMAFCAEST